MNHSFKIAYGILLTDISGYNLHSNYHNCFDNVREIHDALEIGFDSSKWLFVVPGIIYPQFLLGFEIILDKNIDFNKIHKQWISHIKTAPISIIEQIAFLPEPNIHVISSINSHHLLK